MLFRSSGEKSSSYERCRPVSSARDCPVQAPRFSALDREARVRCLPRMQHPCAWLQKSSVVASGGKRRASSDSMACTQAATTSRTRRTSSVDRGHHIAVPRPARPKHAVMPNDDLAHQLADVWRHDIQAGLQDRLDLVEPMPDQVLQVLPNLPFPPLPRHRVGRTGVQCQGAISELCAIW